MARLSRRTTTVGINNYLTDYGYSSSTGLLESLTYPASTGGYRLKLRYDYQNGYLKKVSDFNASSTVFWEAAATDARGNVVDETLGNGLRTIRGYDPVTGWLDHIETGPGGGTLRQNLEYQWDRVGNLTQRKDVNRTLTEDFEYDNLHRLDRSLRNGTQNLDLSYDLLGNITYKSDVGGGTWSYHASKKNAVTNAAGNVYGYDANGNQTSRNGQSVTWTSYNYPKRVNHASGVYHEFSYGPDRQRYQQVYKNGGTTETTVLIGGLLEKRTLGSVTEYRHHIQVGGRPVALYTRPTSGSITTEYFLTDHLGSIDAVTTASGALLAGESFSAFGERRDPNDWSGPPSSLDLNKIAGVTQRGYTGHTNLEQGSLIHMNGRIADAKTGRFLSADPFIPDPGLTQAFNRYSYVYNRPMSFTDPSGFAPCFGADAIVCVGVIRTGLNFIFGSDRKKSPPKGCFVAPTGCYGQAGVPRTPGFNSLVASGWEDQPPWILNSTQGQVYWPTADEMQRENLRRFFEDLVYNSVDELVLNPIREFDAARRAAQEGDYTGAAIGTGTLACTITRLCRGIERFYDKVVGGATTWAKRLVTRQRDVPNGRPASSVNAGDALDRKLRALEGAQQNAVRSRTLPDGRTRYYGPETPATNPGPTRGRSVVTEYDPRTGNVRQWMENYDHAGNVVRVRPSMRNGEVLRGQHYPPTGRELGQ